MLNHINGIYLQRVSLAESLKEIHLREVDSVQRIDKTTI